MIGEINRFKVYLEELINDEGVGDLIDFITNKYLLDRDIRAFSLNQFYSDILPAYSISLENSIPKKNNEEKNDRQEQKNQKEYNSYILTDIKSLLDSDPVLLSEKESVKKKSTKLLLFKLQRHLPKIQELFQQNSKDNFMESQVLSRFLNDIQYLCGMSFIPFNRKNVIYQNSPKNKRNTLKSIQTILFQLFLQSHQTAPIDPTHSILRKEPRESNQKKSVKFQDEVFNEAKEELKFSMEDFIDSIKTLIEVKGDMILLDINNELKEREIMIMGSDLKDEDQFVSRLQKQIESYHESIKNGCKSKKERDIIRNLINVTKLQLKEYQQSLDQKKEKQINEASQERSKNSKLEALREIFEFYTKQKIRYRNKSSFDSINQKQSLLEMGEFNIFCRDFSIPLDKERIKRIYRVCFSGKKNDQFSAFVQSVDMISEEINNQKIEKLQDRLKQIEQLEVERLKKVKRRILKLQRHQQQIEMEKNAEDIQNPEKITTDSHSQEREEKQKIEIGKSGHNKVMSQVINSQRSAKQSMKYSDSSKIEKMNIEHEVRNLQKLKKEELLKQFQSFLELDNPNGFRKKLIGVKCLPFYMKPNKPLSSEDLGKNQEIQSSRRISSLEIHQRNEEMQKNRIPLKEIKRLKEEKKFLEEQYIKGQNEEERKLKRLQQKADQYDLTIDQYLKMKEDIMKEKQQQEKIRKMREEEQKQKQRKEKSEFTWQKIEKADYKDLQEAKEDDFNIDLIMNESQKGRFAQKSRNSIMKNNVINEAQNLNFEEPLNPLLNQQQRYYIHPSNENIYQQQIQNYNEDFFQPSNFHSRNLNQNKVERYSTTNLNRLSMSQRKQMPNQSISKIHISQDSFDSQPYYINSSLKQLNAYNNPNYTGNSPQISSKSISNLKHIKNQSINQINQIKSIVDQQKSSLNLNADININYRNSKQDNLKYSLSQPKRQQYIPITQRVGNLPQIFQKYNRNVGEQENEQGGNQSERNHIGRLRIGQRGNKRSLMRNSINRHIVTYEKGSYSSRK